MTITREQAYEENETKIQELTAQIDEAACRRDYATAEVLQIELDDLLEYKKQLTTVVEGDNTTKKLRELEKQRLNEESEVKRILNEKTDKLLNEAHIRLQQMKERHANEISALETKFNNPLFGAVRLSSNVQALLRAENYYAKKRNYKMANAVKNQITERTQQEIDLTNSLANQTVQAKISAAIKRHAIELQGFRDKLENDKNNIKQDATRSILRIHNKYVKLRHGVLGNQKADPYASRTVNQEAQNVFKAIDHQFAPMIRQANLEYTPTAPSSAQNSENNLGGSAPVHSPSARNPRVQRALERSLRAAETNQI